MVNQNKRLGFTRGFTRIRGLFGVSDHGSSSSWPCHAAFLAGLHGGEVCISIDPASLSLCTPFLSQERKKETKKACLYARPCTTPSLSSSFFSLSPRCNQS